MDTLDQLSVALGFATLAGVNLYLTVLITGLAIRFNWVALAEQYDQLAILGSPAVIIAAGVFFLAEFFSDKIPWVDSAWDTVHTLIRPIGGALLAINTLGVTDPAFEVIIGLLAGGATLVTHGLKAGTRLAVNTSPEPVSNIVVSTAEDTAVVGGLALMAVSPLIAGVVFATFLGLAIYLLPKMFRRTRAFAWLLYQKLAAPPHGEDQDDRGSAGDVFISRLRDDENLALLTAVAPRQTDVLWVADCVTGASRKFPGITSQTFGKLVCDAGSRGKLHFIGRRRFRRLHAELPLGGLDIAHQSRLLSEDVVLSAPEKSDRRNLVLRFPRGQRAIACKVVEEMLTLQKAVGTTQTPTEPTPEPVEGAPAEVEHETVAP